MGSPPKHDLILLRRRLLFILSLATASVFVVEGQRRVPSTFRRSSSQLQHHTGGRGSSNWDSNEGHGNNNDEDYVDLATLLQQQHRDSLDNIDDLERLLAENMRRNAGPDLALAGSKKEVGLQNLVQLQQELEDNIMKRVEDIAEESTKKCHAIGVPIDYNGLKADLSKCVLTALELVINKIEEVMSVIQENAVAAELVRIQRTIEALEPLSTKQEAFLKKTITTPVCSTLKPLRAECQNNVKYPHLAHFKQCKSDVEKDDEEFGTMFLEDFCRNDAQWLFDFWNAEPIKCIHAYRDAFEGYKWKRCMAELEPYQVDRRNPQKQVKQMETHEEFCYVSGRLGTCYSDALMNSCEDNPRPGQILKNAFKETGNLWSVKCGASSLAGSAASMLITIVMWALTRNFFF